MQELLAVALGGSIGAVSRYLVTNYIFIRWHCHWPWATFIVNAAGCLAMGFLMVLITEKGLLTPYWRLLLCVGFLGGLTTFSSPINYQLHLTDLLFVCYLQVRATLLS